MQLMIDTTAETAIGLRRIAAMLVFAADQIETVPAGTVSELVAKYAPAAPPAPAAPVVIVPPAPPAAKLPSAAEAFAKVPEVPAAPLVPPAPSVGYAGEQAGAATTTAAVSIAVELDGVGLPWDARIHSTPAKKNANGLWRMRRGVENALIETVEAELRANYPKPVTVTNVGQTTLTLVPANGAPVVPVPPGASVTVPLPPGATAPGVPSPPAGAPSVSTGNDAFRVMMDRFSKRMGPNDKLGKPAMAAFFAAIGITGWPDLYHKADLIPQVTAEAERLLAL